MREKARKLWIQAIERHDSRTGTNCCADIAAQLAEETADARAEEIGQILEKQARDVLRSSGADNGYVYAAVLARSTITKPKTREQRLEDALQLIAMRWCPGCAEAQVGHDPSACARNIARRALEP